MGWPEAMLGVFGVVQVCFLAWLTHWQQHVKRQLNGHQDYVTSELQNLGRLVRDSERKRPEDFIHRS